MSKVPRNFSQVRGLNEPARPTAARPASESIRSRFRSTSLHSPVDRIQAVFRSSVLVSRQNVKPLQPSSFCAHERRHPSPSPRGLGLSPTCRTRTAGCRGLPARQAHTCHAPSRFTPFVRCFRLSPPSTASHHHRGVRNAFAASAARSGDPAVREFTALWHSVLCRRRATAPRFSVSPDFRVQCRVPVRIPSESPPFRSCSGSRALLQRSGAAVTGACMPNRLARIRRG
jgi:hypothetical protein